MGLLLDRLDHLVMTVSDIEASCDFYCRCLGMEREVFGPEGRVALKFGMQKINLHQAGQTFEPKAHLARPGTEDLCFVTRTALAVVVEKLRENGIEILKGPVRKTGALGPMMSIYLRDPDQNLLEISNYDEGTARARESFSD